MNILSSKTKKRAAMSTDYESCVDDILVHLWEQERLLSAKRFGKAKKEAREIFRKINDCDASDAALDLVQEMLGQFSGRRPSKVDLLQQNWSLQNSLQAATVNEGRSDEDSPFVYLIPFSVKSADSPSYAVNADQLHTGPFYSEPVDCPESTRIRYRALLEGFASSKEQGSAQ